MSEKIAQIRAELAKLDAKNDAHWTQDGLPRLDVLDTKGRTRQEVTDAAPKFSRANTSFDEVVKEPEPEVTVRQVDDDEDVVAELELEVEQAERELADFVKGKEDIERKVARLQLKRDELVTKLQKARGPAHSENIKGIQAVLARSAAERAARAEVAQGFRDAGIRAEMFQPGSALDRAMARARKRGATRPNLLPSQQVKSGAV